MTMSADMEVISRVRAFGGEQGVYIHSSDACRCDMTFALYLPPQAIDAVDPRPAPVLWWLSGLTCTHENAMTKAGFQGWAAKHGLALVFPDTSPRGEGVADDDAVDLGQGAGFYVDATEAPWAPHFAMRRYVLEDLTGVIAANFPLDMTRQGIFGHSMGGHGALTLALSDPARFKSVSAFAPIANPSRSEWGRRQLAAYLGPDEARWAEADAAALLRARGWPRDLLVDQGDDDPFLGRLNPDALVAAAEDAGVPATVRRHPGYDHSYFFVSSFAEEHIAWHAERLSD